MSSKINHLKRILFVITQSEMGGAQRFFLELLPRLDKNKYELAIAIGSDHAISNEFIRSLIEQNFKVFNLKHLKRNQGFLFLQDWLGVFELRKLIKKFGPDTLFLNSSKAGFIGSLASAFPSKIKGVKVIYRIGGWTFNDPWSWWKKRFWIMLEKVSAKWKDIIIVNNQHDFDQAVDLKIGSPEKIKLIHNGIDPYKIEFLPREEARRKLLEKIKDPAQRAEFQQKGNIGIGTITNLYPSKGVKYLIQAASELKNENFIFLVIGDGDERESLENLIREKGLKHQFFILGHLENAKQYLPAFDIFVLPSIKEGFPWAVLEAMAAKLPIIATKVGAVPEIIEDGKNGFLVEPGQPKQIAQKIEELFKNEHLKKELGIQAHQTLLFKFSPEKMIREIEAVL